MIRPEEKRHSERLPSDDGSDDQALGEFEAASDTQALARSAKAGDAERFGELYERIAPALYAWAALRVRPALRTTIDPQDVVQEVWCRAWRAFAGFDPGTTSFRMWVFRIAKNVMLEAFRKAQRSSGPVAGPTTRMFQLQNVPDSATNVSRRMARHEGLRVLLDWVGELDADQKKLFVHCGLEGLTYAEVGARMQLNKDTVAKRWQALRERAAQFALPKELLAAE